MKGKVNVIESIEVAHDKLDEIIDGLSYIIDRIAELKKGDEDECKK